MPVPLTESIHSAAPSHLPDLHRQPQIQHQLSIPTTTALSSSNDTSPSLPLSSVFTPSQPLKTDMSHTARPNLRPRQGAGSAPPGEIDRANMLGSFLGSTGKAEDPSDGFSHPRLHHQPRSEPHVHLAGSSSTSPPYQPSYLDIDKLIQIATSQPPPSPIPFHLAPNSHGLNNNSASSGPGSGPGQAHGNLLRPLSSVGHPNGQPRSSTPSYNNHNISASSSNVSQNLTDTRVCLFVGNLPFRVRWQDVKDLFRRAGTVLRADVSLGADNRSKGHGLVLLGSREDAIRAIEMFNGYNWQTRILEVRPERLPPEFEQHAPPLLNQNSSSSLTTSSASFPNHAAQINNTLNMNSVVPSSSPMYPSNSNLYHPIPGLGTPSAASMLFNHSSSQSQQQHAFGPDGHGRSSDSPFGSRLGASPAMPTIPIASTRTTVSSPAISTASRTSASISYMHSQSPRTGSPSLSASASTAASVDGRILTPKPSTDQSVALEEAMLKSLRISGSGESVEQGVKQSKMGPNGMNGASRLGFDPALALSSSASGIGSGARFNKDQLQSMGIGPGELGVGKVLFVGNLPFHIQWQDLKDLFRTAGNIIRADVAQGSDGRSKGFGSVVFGTEADALNAIAMFDGYEINGRKLQVFPEQMNPFQPSAQQFLQNNSVPNLPHFYAPGGPHQQALQLQTQQQISGRLGGSRTPFDSLQRFELPTSPLYGPTSQTATSNAVSSMTALGGNGHQLASYDSHGTGAIQFPQHGGLANAYGAIQTPSGSQGQPIQQLILQQQQQQTQQQLQQLQQQPMAAQQQRWSQPLSSLPEADRKTESDEQVQSRSLDRMSGGAETKDDDNKTTASQKYLSKVPQSQPSQQQQQRPYHRANAPHPGRIDLPQPYFAGHSFSTISPLQGGGRGMPLLTPSMPSFQFNAFPTPPLFPQFLSPGLGLMSPSLQSPPLCHPFLNPAPGAPLMFPSNNVTPGPGPPPLHPQTQSTATANGYPHNMDLVQHHGHNPMFPSMGSMTPSGFTPIHSRMETPGSIYFGGGIGMGDGSSRVELGGNDMRSIGAVGFKSGMNPIEERSAVGSGVSTGSAAAGRSGGGGSSSAESSQVSGGYPFPVLSDEDVDRAQRDEAGSQKNGLNKNETEAGQEIGSAASESGRDKSEESNGPLEVSERRNSEGLP